MLCCSEVSSLLLYSKEAKSQLLVIIGLITLVVGIIFKRSVPNVSISFGGIGLSLIVAAALYSCTSNKTYASEPPAGEKELRLERGKHRIQLLWGDKGVHNLTMIGPIYHYPNAQFGRMPNPGCLVMYKPDFWTIQGEIHPGAFGGDFIDIDDEWMAVWKIPADLKHIEGWTFSAKISQEDVGIYPLGDDTYAFIAKGQDSPLPWGAAQGVDAKKIRAELPPKEGNQFKIGMQLPSDVHHFVTLEENSRRIPGFSTGNLFGNFHQPTLEEKARIAQLLVELDQLGIKAFMCNQIHHALVLYKNAHDELLTPEAMAQMLQGERGNAIKAAFQKARKVNFNVEAWAESFITCYDPSSEGYIGPHQLVQ